MQREDTKTKSELSCRFARSASSADDKRSGVGYTSADAVYRPQRGHDDRRRVRRRSRQQPPTYQHSRHVDAEPVAAAGQRQLDFLVDADVDAAGQPNVSPNKEHVNQVRRICRS